MDFLITQRVDVRQRLGRFGGSCIVRKWENRLLDRASPAEHLQSLRIMAQVLVPVYLRYVMWHCLAILSTLCI